MQLVQTRRRLLPPFTRALTGRRFTFQRRLLTLCACEMVLPERGPLPQTSHTCAMTRNSGVMQNLVPKLLSYRTGDICATEASLSVDQSFSLSRSESRSLTD